MVRESDFVLVPAAFDARIENVKVPVTVGTPLIKPVEELSASPAGRAPLVSVHVIGVPPLAVSVAEYGVPAVPLERVVVVIAGGRTGEVMVNPKVRELLPKL